MKRNVLVVVAVLLLLTAFAGQVVSSISSTEVVYASNDSSDTDSESSSKLGDIKFIIYLVLGYWSTGKTIYKNKILIGTSKGIFFQRLAMGFILGFILIPIAIICSIVSGIKGNDD